MIGRQKYLTPAVVSDDDDSDDDLPLVNLDGKKSPLHDEGVYIVTVVSSIFIFITEAPISVPIINKSVFVLILVLHHYNSKISFSESNSSQESSTSNKFNTTSSSSFSETLDTQVCPVLLQ